jgi:hypothetical protein
MADHVVNQLLDTAIREARTLLNQSNVPKELKDKVLSIIDDDAIHTAGFSLAMNLKDQLDRLVVQMLEYPQEKTPKTKKEKEKEKTEAELLKQDVCALQYLQQNLKARSLACPVGTINVIAQVTDKYADKTVYVLFQSPDNDGRIYARGMVKTQTNANNNGRNCAYGYVNKDVWDCYKTFMTNEEEKLSYIKKTYPTYPVIYVGHGLGATFARWAALEYHPSNLVTCAEYASDSFAFCKRNTTIQYRHYYSSFDAFCTFPMLSKWDASRNNIVVERLGLDLVADLIQPSAEMLSAVQTLWSAYNASNIELKDHVLNLATYAKDHASDGVPFIAKFHSLDYLLAKIAHPLFKTAHANDDAKSWYEKTFGRSFIAVTSFNSG